MHSDSAITFAGSIVALVTGASRGIGQAIALRLAANGVTVVGTATSPEGVARINDRLCAAGNAGCGVLLDIASPGSVDAALRRIHDEIGVPSILINNAGIIRDKPLVFMPQVDWDNVIAIDLNAVQRMCRACLAGMLKLQAGRIINIASIAAVRGSAGQCNYAAAKAGIIGMSRSLAREIAPANITVNIVVPGLIDTDMTASLDERQRRHIMQNVALGRAGRAEEVAAAVAFLASPQAAWITGATLHVDGGMH